MVIRECLFRLLKNYTKISEKDSIFKNVEIGSQHVYDDNDKYIKRKIKSYGYKLNTDF